MDEEERTKIASNCRRSCACSKPRCPKKEKGDNERTFVSFMCESVSVIAFIIFGSIVFWLAVGEILIDFIKKLYHSERHVKMFIGILFSVLLLSMLIHFHIGNTKQGKDVPRSQEDRKVKVTETGSLEGTKQKETQKAPNTSSMVPLPSQPPPPTKPPQPPEYLKISLKEKHLETLNSEAPVKEINKKIFTLTIADEKRKEVFRTTKSLFVPELTMEKSRPALVVVLKEILLEDY